MNSTSSSRRRPRTRAVAASGLVLGVGASVVLANWSESLFTSAAFGKAEFGIEGSANGGGTWELAPTAGSALDLVLSLTEIRPGQTTYAPISLRVVAGSVDADVQLYGAIESGPLFTALRYSFKQVSTCNQANMASGPYLVNTATLGTNATSTFALPAGATPDIAGSATPFCFAITLPDTADNWLNLSGSATTASWRFAATPAE